MDKDKNLFNGFQTLWIQLDNVGSQNTRPQHRYQLFLKEHSVRNQDVSFPKGRTLFVINVPPFISPESVEFVFSNACGDVENVKFSKDSGFNQAFVVFKKASSLTKALSLDKQMTLVIDGKKTPIITGLKKYCMDYRDSIANEVEIKKEIEQFFLSYNKKEAERLEKEKLLEEEDENGWSTVTSRKKRGKKALLHKGSAIRKIQLKADSKHKKQLQNFYTFQIRESKKKDYEQLKEKFELDKKKISTLKSLRKFKPL